MLALLTLLGLLTALSEGFSISLIIPLLASGTEGAQQNANYWFARLFSPFSGDERTMIIAVCFLVGVALKNDGRLLGLRHSRWLAENFAAASVKQLGNPRQIPQDFQQSHRRHGREFARGFGDFEAQSDMALSR